MQRLEREVQQLSKDVTTIKDDMKEALTILSGNRKVVGDNGIAGRLLEVEKEVEDLQRMAYIREDYPKTKARIAKLEEKWIIGKAAIIGYLLAGGSIGVKMICPELELRATKKKPSPAGPVRAEKWALGA